MAFRQNGSANYIIGVSRSGKTQYAMRQIFATRPKRLVIWDFGGQWAGVLKTSGLANVEVLSGRASLAGALKGNVDDGIYCYHPPSFTSDLKQEFLFFCGCAFLWVKEKPATVIVEEVAAVTSGGTAQGEWQTIQTQMQKYGGCLYTIIQRAQEGDKTTLTQATNVIVFRQSTADADYIIKMLDMTREMIPAEDLYFTKIDKAGNKSAGLLQLSTNQNPANHKIIEKKQ